MLEIGAERADLTVDRDGELPVTVQLVWKLRALIVSGRLGPGERLPAVRELAGAAGVNVNTARTVYARLERDGFLATEPGRGSFVRHDLPPGAEIERIAAQAAERAAGAGLDPRDVATAVYAASSATADSSGEPPAHVPPAHVGDDLPDLDADDSSTRQELRRQIAKLEADLAAYREDLPPRDGPLHRPWGRLVSTVELERERDRLITWLHAARAAAAAREERRDAARRKLERMIREPRRFKWAAVSGEDVGDPGCKAFRSTPRLGLLGMMLGWWRVKLSSGCP